ncbi:MAG: ribonuclease HI family protein [Patescibacteria group bacterium]
MNNLIIFSDGGSRGNPGPAAIGFVIRKGSGKELVKLGREIGNTTNNVAEYTAILEALKWVKENVSLDGDLKINCYLDSLLVVRQLEGKFKIKDSKMKALTVEIKKLESEMDAEIFYLLVPREENKIADSLVNQALDKSF